MKNNTHIDRQKKGRGDDGLPKENGEVRLWLWFSAEKWVHKYSLDFSFSPLVLI